MEKNLEKIDAQITQLKEVIEKIENKDFSIYYFTLDTKGNPTAGVANIYEHVKSLNELGYKAFILHERDDYKLYKDEDGQGLADWLGDEYALLPHISIQGQTLNVSPSDIILIPEIFSTIMEQIKGFPCKKIVLSQSYDYLLDLLPIGTRWNVDYGFNDVITTSEKQANYIKNLFPSILTHIVPVSIPKYFKDSDKPKIPVVAILTRNQGEAAKIAKAFYLQFPIYKWVTFKELRNLPREKFAEELGKCCLAIWVDETSGFGTFPLEAMETNTPIIGKIPNMVPEWMETQDKDGNVTITDNGIWTSTTTNIPELISTYLKLWLEDSVPTELTDTMEATKGRYSVENQMEKITSVYDSIITNRVLEFKQRLSILELSKK
jgi:glycosyltransferase involved in cell wall biosynthesis